MPNAFDLSLEDLTAELARWGEPAYRARQVYNQLWQRGTSYPEMTDLPLAVRRRLADELPARVQVLAEQEADEGATRKALLRVGERRVIETVLMGYRDRATVCVSSQAGCAMGCGFCATGQMGLEGSLTSGEIASQVIWAARAAAGLPGWTPRRVTNVVFMGMGEPISNYGATRDAVTLMLDPAGMNLGARHITVSTVGVVPGIRRLAVDHPQVSLAVSLHAADDELRDQLVPVNRLWPLRALEAAIQEWRETTHRRPSIEWTMMRGVNDDDDQAAMLAAIAFRLHALVNLIPMNPTPGSSFRPSPRTRIVGFAQVLRDIGVRVTIRDTRGRRIQAACGQLHREAIPPPSGAELLARAAPVEVA